MEPFIGQIIMFAGNFAPRGWALCDGQLLSIAENSALFSILGTTYGGDGRITFGLPDLRGRFPMHAGSGPGRSARNLGSEGGTEQHSLNTAQLPSHAHQGEAMLSNIAEAGSRSRGVPFDAGGEDPEIQIGGRVIEFSTNPVGNNQPVEHMPPFQCVNFIIALTGTYPSRS